MSRDNPTAAKKKEGINLLLSVSFLLELTIAIAAAMWVIYSYAPQYYLSLSFLMLGGAAIFAYVILIKSSKF